MNLLLNLRRPIWFVLGSMLCVPISCSRSHPMAGDTLNSSLDSIGPVQPVSAAARSSNSSQDLNFIKLRQDDWTRLSPDARAVAEKLFVSLNSTPYLYVKLHDTTPSGVYVSEAWMSQTSIREE